MVTIRNARLEDCMMCVELSKIEEFTQPDGSHVPYDYLKSYIDEDEMFLVAEVKGRVVGYILGEPLKGKIAYVALLTVDSQVRGKGIGRKLIDAFLKRCSEKELKYVFGFAPKFNKRTIEFYRKCGFKEGKEHIQFADISG
jgi:ribosomal-protein-alanine N-acetyltransferase